MADTETDRRRVNLGIVLVIVAFALKLPMAILTIAYPTGSEGLVPDSGGTAMSGVGNLAFMLCAAALVWLRRWVGLGVATLLIVMSSIGGFQLIAADAAVWGVLQLATNALAAVGVIAALATGALRGSSW